MTRSVFDYWMWDPSIDGKYIKAMRKIVGMTQGELGDIFEVSASAIAHRERGRVGLYAAKKMIYQLENSPKYDALDWEQQDAFQYYKKLVEEQAEEQINIIESVEGDMYDC